MTHNHLRFELVDQIDRNTNQNEDGGSAEPDAAGAGYSAHQQREKDDNDKEECVKPVEPAGRLGDEVGRGAAGPVARDESTVFLEIVGHFDRIELNHRIKEGEADDQQSINDIVGNIARKIREPFGKSAVRIQETGNG